MTNKQLFKMHATAMRWKAQAGKQNDDRGYTRSKQEAFQMILPKNISERKKAIWLNHLEKRAS